MSNATHEDRIAALERLTQRLEAGKVSPNGVIIDIPERLREMDRSMLILNVALICVALAVVIGSRVEASG
jgi:hypothetical protein